jgi:molybdate transport system regulatory protein
MSRLKPSRKTLWTRLHPRVKVWIETDEGFGFGLGLIEILRAIERAGAIKQAADDLGRSYRHIWSRVKDAEKALGQPLVETHVGGQGTRRSTLTDAAHLLVADYLAIRNRILTLAEREFARRARPE